MVATDPVSFPTNSGVLLASDLSTQMWMGVIPSSVEGSIQILTALEAEDSLVTVAVAMEPTSEEIGRVQALALDAGSNRPSNYSSDRRRSTHLTATRFGLSITPGP